VRCGLPTAEDCASLHWGRELHGQRQRGGQWRADCPVCHAERALEWDVPGRSVRWKSWCAEHDRDFLRPVLAEMLPGCLPRRGGQRAPVDHDDLIRLAQRDLPAAALRIGMLRLAGFTAAKARAELGLAKSTYYDALRNLGS
jgi:hypothetical protein